MIYADYNGSAPLLPAVKEYLKKRLETNLYANPNAIHSMGQKIAKGIEKCREVIAESVGALPQELFFNSGSSEGISQILFSVLEYGPKDKSLIITSPIEHVAVSSAIQFYQERRGFKVAYVDVDENGLVSLESLRSLLSQYKDKVALVCIMAVNNETGVIQPYQQIGELCHAHNCIYFSDTTQLIGKGDFHFKQSHMDYAVCSGHKVGALTGTGFVLALNPAGLKPYLFGGHQEHGKRAGTQNYLGIETLAVAMSDFNENKKKLSGLKSAREKFEKNLKADFPLLRIMGEKSPRLAGTSLMSYPGIHGQAVQIELESHDIFVTTSAACSDNQPETSAILKAMKVPDDIGRGVIRLSLSYNQGEADYEEMRKALTTSYRKLSKIKSF
jgi:cysteine desulfurase